jgi:hypothetical protein
MLQQATFAVNAALLTLSAWGISIIKPPAP